jgi:acyl carrier protein phosphodiesterase
MKWFQFDVNLVDKTSIKDVLSDHTENMLSITVECLENIFRKDFSDIETLETEFTAIKDNLNLGLAVDRWFQFDTNIIDRDSVDDVLSNLPNLTITIECKDNSFSKLYANLEDLQAEFTTILATLNAE